MATLFILYPDLNFLSTLSQISRADCYVVEHTEAIDGVSTSRVMAWGSYCSKSVFPLIRHDFIDTFKNPTNCNFRARFRMLIEIRIEDCDVCSVGCFRPQLADVFYVPFFVC